MNRYLILLIIFSLAACKPSKYEGYTELSSDLNYQRVALGEGNSYHPDSCFLDYTVLISPFSHKSKGIKKEIKFAQIPRSVLADSLLNNCKAGDQIRIITTKEDYLTDLCRLDESLDSAVYLIDLKIDEVYNLYAQEEDPNVIEFKEINTFLSLRSTTDDYTYYEGIWIKKLSSTENSKDLKGDIIVDYKGYSLVDEEWDIPDFPLKFHIEDQYQVIRGIELALSTMHFQDSVSVIIPSYLAFGELGSKNGNIPPYKALHYMLKVHHPDSFDFSSRGSLE